MRHLNPRIAGSRSPLLVIASAFVLIATIGVYYPGLAGPFVFDDTSNVLLPQVRIENLSLENLREAAFATASGPLGRPISMLSFALNYYFSGYDTYYFKLTNLLIHLLNGIGLFALTYSLLGRAEAAATWSSRHRAWISLAVAAAWLLHPLNLTSVLYIVQRMTSLAALFSVAALLCYVHGRNKIVAGKSSGFAIVVGGVLLGGALAVFSKESGALLPLYIVLIEIYFFRLAAHPRIARHFRSLFIGGLAALVFVVAAVVLLDPSKFLMLDGYQTRNFTLWERLLSESRALWLYIKFLFLPVISEMGIFHDDIPVSRSMVDPVSTLFALIGIAVLAVLVPLTYRRLPLVSFAIAWFLVGHSLESTVIPLELIHEHRNYLPAFGPILGFVVTTVTARSHIRDTPHLRYAFLLVYILLLGSATLMRAQQWQSDASLNHWEAINHPESARAHVGLAVFLHNAKKYPEAEEHFRKAVDLSAHDSGNMIRLVHHLYEATGNIPDHELGKLAQVLRRNAFDSVTIWVFDMLLAVTQKDLRLHKQLLEMYEELAARTDVRLASDWQQSMHISLSRNYRDVHKDFGKALHHILQASKLQKKAPYYLEAANLYISQGLLEQARTAVKDMKELDLYLNEQDRKQLAYLESFFKEVDAAVLEVIRIQQR